MTIAHVALAVLAFFACEAVLLTALWKRASYLDPAPESQSARRRLLGK